MLQLSVSSSEFSENANSFFRKFVSRTIFSKNVIGSVFCAEKRNKLLDTLRTRSDVYREPFLMIFFLFSIQFSIENHSN